MRKTHALLAAAWIAILLALFPVMPAIAHDGDLLLLASRIDVNARGMVFSPPYLYLITEQQLVIYDLSIPDAPEPIGVFVPAKPLIDLAVQDNRVYAIDNDHLTVIDVSSPTSPTLIARSILTLDYQATAVAVSGDELFVIDSFDDLWGDESELRAFDVSDLTQARLVDTLTLSGRLRDDRDKQIFALGDTLYIQTWTQLIHGGESFLTVIDVGDNGELVQRYSVSVWSSLAMAPTLEGVVYLGSLHLGLPNCGWHGPQALQSVQTNESTPVLSPPRHYLGPCEYYSALNVTGEYLYGADGSYLTAYRRVAPDREKVQIVYPFPSYKFGNTAIEASEDVVAVAYEGGVLILRWAASADEAYLPIIHSGAAVEPTLSP